MDVSVGRGAWLAKAAAFNATTTDSTSSLQSEIWIGEEFLSLVTVVVSSLSLVGLIFAFITYSLFSDVRSLSGTTLMNLLAALFLLQLLFVVGVQKPRDHQLCVGLIFSLHGLGLSVFTWLAAMTHDLYVTSRESGFSLQPVQNIRLWTFCRYSVVAWGIPIACTAVAATLQRTSKETDNCWLARTTGVTYAFALPLAFITLFMTIYAARAAIVVRCIAGMQGDRKWSRKWRRRRYSQLFLYVKIYALTAVIWLCGVCARASGSLALLVVFQLLFSVQGVLVAVAYTCNGRVLKIYSHTFGPRKEARRWYGSPGDLSRSASLQLLTWEPPPDAV